MMFEAQREQKIWPRIEGLSDASRDKREYHHTADTAVMFSPPRREHAFAVITLLAVFVIHPILSRETFLQKQPLSEAGLMKSA